MLVCSVQIITRLDSQSNFQMFTLYFGRHVGAHLTWRFHTKLCKFLRNISTNICGLGKRTDVKLAQVSCLFISNKITISWLYPLNGFRFIFLLRDSENDLLRVFLAGHTVAIVAYCVVKMIRRGSLMIEQFFDTMVVASSDKEWL